MMNQKQNKKFAERFNMYGFYVLQCSARKCLPCSLLGFLGGYPENNKKPKKKRNSRSDSIKVETMKMKWIFETYSATTGAASSGAAGAAFTPGPYHFQTENQKQINICVYVILERNIFLNLIER